MNYPVQIANSRIRQTGACICLLALLLVYAPMASATVLAITGACCTGDLCPIHGNHHPAQTGSPQEYEEAPMDCGDGGHHMSKMQACSMSCCQTVEPTAVYAHSFLLTPFPVPAALAPLFSASIALTPAKVSPVFAPLAPPPKPASHSR